jgi:hypothetical protein
MEKKSPAAPDGGIMADVSEALERLADLHTRGILTQAEFNAQKAALLNPAPAQAAAPAVERIGGGVGARVALIAAGMLVLAFALWAVGILHLPHYSRPETQAEIDAELRGDSPKPVGTASVAPASISAAQPAVSTAAASSNPMIGDWVNDGTPSAECPSKVTFAASTMTITMVKSGKPEIEIEPINYTVQSPTMVLVTNTNSPDSSMPFQVQNGRLSMSATCSFRR